MPLPPLPHSVSLHRLFPKASFVGCGDIAVQDVTEDSRQANPQAAFAALRGTRVDGAHFAAEAVGRGCKAILTEQPLAAVRVPQCVVPDARAAYAKLCDAVLGHPARHLKVVGVTGTNGKTTTSWWMRSILEASGRHCGLLGTIVCDDGRTSEEAGRTTPDSKQLAQWLRRMVDANCTHCSIEVSSHALDQRRTAGIRLAAAAITNVTQDHFDYHGNFENYLAAKLRIIDEVAPGGLLAVNADDPHASRFIAACQSAGKKCVTYGIDCDADVRAKILNESLDGTTCEFTLNAIRTRVRVPIPARHNVSNCLAAAIVVSHLGVTQDQIIDGIEHAPPVPGRLERVDCGQEFHVFVDYAHTDDAIRRVVTCLKHVCSGRVFCVFGAGGDRDRTKRPKMAAAAALADVVVVTSDNPRTESPQSIIEEILAGLPTGFANFHVDADRRCAIEWALSEARPGDCVLIAGKGHEPYQIIGKEKHPFDDRDVVRQLLAKSPTKHASANQSSHLTACGSSTETLCTTQL